MTDLTYTLFVAADSSEDPAATLWGDLIGMALIAVMWVLSLAALAGAAWLMGRWFKRREERMRRPADPAQDPWSSLSRTQQRSVKRGQTRRNNASDFDGYV